MLSVALLRGVNVGGANKVDMKELKSVFEANGMESVRTYINSGNVIFSTKTRGLGKVGSLLEDVITERFGFDVKVIVRDTRGLRAIVNAIPRGWTNDQTMRCNVIFLADEVNRPSIIHRFHYRPEIEDVRYVRGAVIWRIDSKDASRSGMTKVVGTPIYKQITIRNCNTARKLLELMESAL
jgi:uncharacterized protein (DUF1697 family)